MHPAERFFVLDGGGGELVELLAKRFGEVRRQPGKLVTYGLELYPAAGIGARSVSFPAGSDGVRFRGKTGSHGQTVKMTL